MTILDICLFDFNSSCILSNLKYNLRFIFISLVCKCISIIKAFHRLLPQYKSVYHEDLPLLLLYTTKFSLADLKHVRVSGHICCGNFNTTLYIGWRYCAHYKGTPKKLYCSVVPISSTCKVTRYSYTNLYEHLWNKFGNRPVKAS